MFRFLLLVVVLMSLSATFVAFAGEDAVTPYGDYCKDCTDYGVCKDLMAPHDAVKSIHRYYREKGYRMGAVYHKGRFIEADIYKKDRQVDKVLFDRKTGRLRSIY
jgi:hypothetical protein